MRNIVNEQARPFFLRGGPVGCLLIHGFTGSPAQMRWLGDYLLEKGFSVLGVRLAGHGTDIDDLRRARWRDWLAAVEDGWHVLNDSVDQVVVIGLSMGGVLASLVADMYPAAGLVMMSTPYALPADPRLRFARALSLLWPFVDKGHDRDRDAAIYGQNFAYDTHPTRAIAELVDLLAEMRTALPMIEQPALVMHSREDSYVPPHNADAVLRALGSAAKEMAWIQHGGHVITLEPDRLEVYAQVAAFVKKVCESDPG